MDQEKGAAARVGTHVAGKYELLRLLGEGGMGAVYEAEHAFTKRRVAVKLMHPRFARSGIAAERFLREAQAPGTIGHPGIVEVLDGGHGDDGSLYLVLELLPGETLAAALRRGRPALPWLCAVVLELLDALEAAHAAGFVHRDIKPENVFLSPTDTGTPLVKLLDFGVAGVLSGGDERPNLTRAGAVLGTPLYMSPEQALGRRVDARADLWSVGAILYQALTGQPPFGGDNMQQLIVSISTEEHLPLSVASPGLPLRMVKVVERALQKDPAQRWPSAAEMAAALEQALGGAPRTSVADVVSARRSERARAQLGRTVIAGVIGLAAIALGAFIVLRPREPGAGDPQLKLTISPPEVSPAADPPPSASAQPAPPAAAPDAPSAVAATVPAAQPSAQPAPPAAAPDAPSAAFAPAPPAAAQPLLPSAPGAAPAGLDAAALSAELARHDAALQRCHQDVVVAALMNAPPGATPPELSVMRLDLALTIAPSGAVRQVELGGDGPEPLRRCVREVAKGFRFGPIGKESEARVPIVFTPNVVRP